MSKIGVSLEPKPLELFSKWSEEQLGLMARGQRLFEEASKSLLGVIRETVEMKAPEESLKKLCGSMLELCNLPLNTLGDNGNWEKYSHELQKLVAGMPSVLSANGFSEEITQYGKATCTNGSKASYAYVNWMKNLLHEQNFTMDDKEAQQALKNCMDATESFIGESVACWMDQVKASNGFVRTGLLKEKQPAVSVPSSAA